MTTPSRLERALEIWLLAEERGDAPDAVLARHGDLADLLHPLFHPDSALGGETGSRPRLGDFDLGREIGRGGMGVVFEARQVSLGRRVAIKILATELTKDPARVARFRREATTLARVEHRNVVRILGAGEDGEQHWLAMEFVEGGTLESRLAQVQAQGGHVGTSLRECVQIVAEIASALAQVHSLGLVHRDVKPSNILIGTDGSPKLSDFGLAQFDRATALTREGTLTGTPFYLPPEVVAGATFTPLGDVWSLGVVLFEVSTLERPFDGETEAVVLQKILRDVAQDPRRKAPGLPVDLAAIVMRALEKEPSRRYGDMLALAADLRAFLELRPTTARPPTVIQRFRRWARREPWRAALALTAAIAISLGAVLLTRMGTLRAGARAESAAEYEAAVAESFLRRADGRRDLAEAAARRARTLRPESGEGIVLECLQRLRFESADAALLRLSELTALPHDDDEACAWFRALLLHRLGRHEEAEALEQQLGEPRSQMGLLLAAGIRVDTGGQEAVREALGLVSLATRLGPPRLLVHAQWATLLRVIGDSAQKIEGARALSRLWPNEPLALHLAAALIQSEDPARALAWQRRALALGLVDSFAHYNLAMYAYAVGDKALAVTTARSVLLSAESLQPPQRQALLQAIGDFAPDELDSTLEQWRSSRPDAEAQASRELGWSAWRRGDLAPARKEFERALASTPNDPGVLQGLATVLQDQGDVPASIAYIDRLLELDPASSAGHALRMHVLSTSSAGEAALAAERERHVRATADHR
ncbi:MAG: protein kinase [Planctomycetota bacterium]